MEIYQNPSYSNLLNKLDQFVRRYYQASIIRGVVVSGIGSITVWFLLFLIEYFLFLPGNFRFSFLLLALLFPLFMLAFLVLPAILSMWKIKRGISHKQAAELISFHFKDIQDRLVNILQLGWNNDREAGDSLIIAAIEQKTREIDPFDFKQVVDLRPPLWLLRTMVVIVLLIAASVSLRPGIITQSPGRVFNYNVAYERPAPFSFVLLSDSLVVYQGKDFTITALVEGEVLPTEVHLVTTRGEFLMKKTDRADVFQFVLKELLIGTTFHFMAAGITSEDYVLKVKQLPGITSFKVSITFPGYLNRLPEVIEGTGDVIVPAGSILDWNVGLKGGGIIDFRSGTEKILYSNKSVSVAHFRVTALTSFRYTILLTDDQKSVIDSLTYTCQVIADQAPTIRVVQEGDTTTPDLFFFSGMIADDHGISKLVFSFGKVESDSAPTMIDIHVTPGILSASFYYSLLVDTLGLVPGKSYNAWFTVFDNNYTTGPSSARSAIFFLRKFTREELSEMSREMATSSLARLRDIMQSNVAQKKQLDNLDYKLETQREVEWSD
ncbi:MAG: hypothetical protein CVU06_04300, partial [Bacteroidetes bacterium HGW-Bacteroidetes-22]